MHALKMMSLMLVVSASLVPNSATARAQTIWYVDDDAPSSGNGASWNGAFKYLQDALAAAVSGDEIRVAGGIYKPDQDEAGSVTAGDRGATFQLVTDVVLYGSYAGLAARGESRRSVLS